MLAIVTCGPDISITAANGRVMKIVIAAQYSEGSGVLTQGELQKLTFASQRVLSFSQTCNLQ